MLWVSALDDEQRLTMLLAAPCGKNWRDPKGEAFGSLV
jgi:hypothetical protein